MRRKTNELWLALLAIATITVMYLFMMTLLDAVPTAFSVYGHGMGIVGFLMMLMTETLYTLRKRSRNARWGRMSSWLQFHIFTGLVGPYLVLLHTSWKFNGVAGILMLLTVVIVVSGFIGRYIYTSVPRSADGIELESGEIERQIATVEAEMEALKNARAAIPLEAGPALVLETEVGAIDTTPPRDMGSGQRPWFPRIFNRSTSTEELRSRELKMLVGRRNLLQRQVRALANTRRLLAIWHTVHIPIGLALFSLAFVHIIAAVYYATLLH